VVIAVTAEPALSEQAWTCLCVNGRYRRFEQPAWANRRNEDYRQQRECMGQLKRVRLCGTATEHEDST
jgi:hypothetical protein